MLGYPDQASGHAQEALSLAEEVSHPFTLAYVEALAAMHYIESRSNQIALHTTEAFLGLAQEQGFALYLVWAGLFQGACWAKLGRTEEGITSLRKGLADYDKTGCTSLRPAFWSWLAEGHLIAGQADEGLKVLDEAFAHVNGTGERYWEAELYRIKGELLLLQGGSEGEAEESFKQALEVAKGQSAKSLELRAAMSMARLWREQSKSAEALELLSGIYGWFTEGFDTPDLVDAKAMLGELA